MILIYSLQVNWMRYNLIGGIMLTSLDMDDFSGMYCTGEIYPLLHAINHQLTAPLPPNPRLFLRNKQNPPPTPTPSPTPPPHRETSTFDWLESSSLYFDYMFANDSLTTTSATITDSTQTSITSSKAYPTNPTTQTTTPSTRITPTTTSTIKTTSSITTSTTTPSTTTLRIQTRPIRPRPIPPPPPPPRIGQWHQTRNSKIVRRRKWPSRRVKTINMMAIDDGQELQRELFTPTTKAASNAKQAVEDQANPAETIQGKEKQLRNILKSSGNVPTHRLINSILMLLEGGSSGEPARLSTINTGNWNRRNPTEQTKTIKNTKRIRNAIIEQPDLTKTNRFRSFS